MNEGRSAVILSVGKSAILCSPSLPLYRLQKVQLEIIFLAVALAWVIQFFSLKIDSIWFLPLWPLCTWICLRISLETCWSLDKITGCFPSSGIAALHNLPQILSNPCSRMGLNLWIALSFLTSDFPDFNAETFPLTELDDSLFCLKKVICRQALSSKWSFGLLQLLFQHTAII